MATTKTTITRAEYLQLVGLMALAERHNEKLKDIAVCALDLTGESDDMGHTYDAVYSGEYDADGLLQRLGITVEDPDPPAIVGGMP